MVSVFADWHEHCNYVPSLFADYPTLPRPGNRSQSVVGPRKWC